MVRSAAASSWEFIFSLSLETQESLNTAKQSGEKDRKVSEADGDKDADKSHVIDEETDTYEGEDATPSVFADIFSDSEEEEEEEEERWEKFFFL